MDVYSKEKRKAYNMEYYQRNKERIAEKHKKYSKDNRDAKRLYENERYRNDPVYRAHRKAICLASKQRTKLKREALMAVPVAIEA